jgi:hypothetical protein
MPSDFESTPRTIAISPEHIEAVLTDAMTHHAKMLPDGGEMLPCIAAFWDDAEQTRLRPACLRKGTIAGIPVGDGRISFKALWATTLAAEFEAGNIPHVEEIDPGDITQPTDEL